MVIFSGIEEEKKKPKKKIKKKKKKKKLKQVNIFLTILMSLPRKRSFCFCL